MKTNETIFLLNFIVVLLFVTLTACDKSDDPGKDSPSTGTVVDVDGNIYKTIKFGTQVWMAENLRTTKYNDGSDIPNVTDKDIWEMQKTGAYRNLKDSESNAATYGRFYNWYTIKTGKLAPAGWHVPTDNEWVILQEYLINNGYNWDGTKEGNKIAKALASTTGWKSSKFSREGDPGFQPEKNNKTGFSAPPCGFYNLNGFLIQEGQYCNFWTSDFENILEADYVSLYYGNESLDGAFVEKTSGFFVRLVKD